jgi:uncharacterized protein involved in copper resistance
MEFDMLKKITTLAIFAAITAGVVACNKPADNAAPAATDNSAAAATTTAAPAADASDNKAS